MRSTITCKYFYMTGDCSYLMSSFFRILHMPPNCEIIVRDMKWCIYLLYRCLCKYTCCSLGQASCVYRVYEIRRSFLWTVSLTKLWCSDKSESSCGVHLDVIYYELLLRSLSLLVTWQGQKMVWTRLVEIWGWENVSILLNAFRNHLFMLIQFN